MESIEKMNLKSLRILADKMGVVWSKKDDEKALRKKVKTQRDAAESAPTVKSGTAFDVTKRAPFTVIVDPKTKKQVRDPTDCFGYFFLDTPSSPDDVDCKKVCPHWKPCKALSADADKVLTAAEDEVTASEEAAEVEDNDLKEAAAAKSSKGKKDKKSKSESILSEEKRPGTIEIDTVLSVEFDMDYALSIDDEDLRRFYRKVAKGGASEMTVEEVVLVFCDTQGVDDVETVVEEIIPSMIQSGDFKILR